MKTIKLPYKSDYDFDELLNQYNSIVRYSYNRFLENKNKKDVEHSTKKLNNISLCDSWILRCGVYDGYSIFKRNKNNKVIFGGKFNFFQRIKNKITKEQFKENRLLPINIQGEECKNGNRKFNFDLNNNKIIFKLNRNKHITLNLPKLKSNYFNDLFKLETLNKTYSIKIDKQFVYISFEEFKTETTFKQFNNRILGIDLNPNYIGISICEYNKNNEQKILHKVCFDLSKLTVKSNESSSSLKSKYLHNKLKFETLNINKEIIKLCKSFQVKHIVIEDLNKIKSNFNKNVNRLNNNKWLKNLMINNLSKHCFVYNLNLIKVLPHYSSMIGNVLYKDFDPINSSLEINRRGYEFGLKKDKTKFYPSFNTKYIQEYCRWKNIIFEGGIDNWKEFCLFLKNSKIRYRVSLEELKDSFKVLSVNSSKSLINQYIF
jgi:IS605 OrfB family transposase